MMKSSTDMVKAVSAPEGVILIEDNKPDAVQAMRDAASGKQGIEVACGDGRVLRILELQAQGGRRMAAADYLRGHEIPVCL